MGAPVLQPTFTGGELSPSLYARVDLARYGTSVRKAKNFIVRPYGGLVNRPGTEFVGEAKSSATQVRLIPFEFSSEIAYVIEMGVGYMRFIYRGAYVELSPGVPAEVVTPWTESQLREVAFTQSADVMFMTHPSHQPIEIKRVTASSFTVSAFQNLLGPFSAINSDESIKVAVSAEQGSVTISANANIFTAGMVGSMFYVEEKDLRGQHPWEAGWRTVGLGTLCRSDGKVYRCSSVPATPSGGWYQTGSIRPIHDTGRAWDGPGDTRTTGTTNYAQGVEWEYLHSGFGVVQITGFTDAQHVTGVVASRIPASCVGGLGTPGSTWTFSGNGSTKTFTITGAVSDSNADYGVTINGVNIQSDPYYAPPGGGGGLCVSVDAFAYVMVDGAEVLRRAGEIVVGDELVLFDWEGWKPKTGIVTRSDAGEAQRYRLVTLDGAVLTCSDTAPIPTIDGVYVEAKDLDGKVVPVRVNGSPRWSRVVEVQDIGRGPVQMITVNNCCFWATDGIGGDLLHHNIKAAQ